jgi:ubiquinone/menaquinone biosynthesis C-methylase UbiE
MAYDVLYSQYDLLTSDVEYEKMADFAVNILMSKGIISGFVLDLACGTGTMSYLLAKRGYEVIGVDSSAEMLSVAYSKSSREQTHVAPVFIHQDMRRLDLYGTVDACICMLDSVNYIIEPEELQQVFRRVHLFLNPGGVFLFDINTPLKFREIDGISFVDEREEEGVFCVWRAALTDRPRTYQFIVDLFTILRGDESGGIWKRESEEQYEYAYEPEELQRMLEKAGFTDIRTYGGTDGRPLAGDEKRIYFTAEKPA